MVRNVVSATAQGSEPPCTPEKSRHASRHEQSSDRDSGESLFITQSAASAAKRMTSRKPATRKPATRKPATRKPATRKPATPSRSVSDNRSEDGREKEDFLIKWDILGDFLITPSPRKPKPKASPRIRFRPRKTVFPFLLKSQKQQHLSLPKHQVLENSEIGGFFKCIKKMHKSKGSPNMLEFVPSDDLEEQNSDHEVTVVNKADFVLKKNKQKWLTRSILERRVQDPEDENLQNQMETFEVLCSDSELSDSAASEQAYIIRSDDEASDGGHVWLVEETQRLTQALHKDARTDTECNSLSLSQGGDVSIQNHTPHKSGTKAHKTARDDLEETLLFARNSDQDSDVTLIDADRGEYVSKSGPGTPRGKSQACSEADGKITQRLSQSISTSPKTRTSLVTAEQEENADNQQCSESQDASQSLLDSHAKVVPEGEIKSPKKKKRLSRKDVEVTDVAQDTVIDPASGPVAIETADSPLFKLVGLGFIKRKRKNKKTDNGSDEIQCEANVDASGGDITGLKTKHKRKLREVEDNTTNEEQSCDTSRLSVGSDSTDISQVKKKKAKKLKLEEREDAEPRVDTQNAQDSGLVSKKAKKKRKRTETNDQDDDATFKQSNGHSGEPGGRLSCSSQGEKTSETTCNVVASASPVKKKKKKRKMKTQDEESGPDVENDQSVETVQHDESQTAVLSSKKTKKNKKTQRTTREEEENDETTNKTSQHVAENPDMRLNVSIQPEKTQTEEETERCSSPNVTILKSVKKKKKKKMVESDSSVFFEERASDVPEHLKRNTRDTLNDAKRKNKEDRSDRSSPVAQSVETPERRKKKKKRHSNGLIEKSSELQTAHEVSGNSQSLISTPSEIRSKKTKKKKNEEIKEADKLENHQTNETDAVIQENNAEKQVTGNSGVKIKKRKKDIEFTDNSGEMISESQVSQSDTPKKPKKKRQNTRCDDEATSAETVSQSHKITDRKKKCKPKTEEHSESQTDDVPPSKKKKRKSTVENVSVLDTQNFSIHSEAETIETVVQNNDALPKIKKKKRKIIVND